MPSAAKIDACIQAATRRLRPDPELRMDIAQELRSHIEDSIEAARACGASDEESVAKALKAFGDPEAVGEQIWRANRRSMRLRAWVKWAARATLVPAAIFLALALVYFAVASGGSFLLTTAWSGRFPENFHLTGSGKWAQWIERRAHDRSPKPDLTQEERLVHHGDANAKTLLEGARSLVDRYPANPVYYGYYATIELHMYCGNYATPRVHALDRRRAENARGRARDELLELLDRGEQLEPDNAFYNYMKASLLLERGA